MKISILGKQLPAFVIAMLVIAGLGSAALVGYISNTVAVDIEVKSPIIAGVSLGRDSWSTTQCLNTVPNDPNYGSPVDSFPECDEIHDWGEGDWLETISISDIHGGETVTLYTKSENIANVEITGFEEAIVTNWDGVTCEDFESVRVRVDSIFGGLGYGTEHDLIALGDVGCRSIDNYHIQFGTSANSLWGAGETDVTKIVVTFKTDASGTYTLTFRVIPAV